MNVPGIAPSSGLGGMEQRLIALEYQLHLVEYRLRRDLLERDHAWRERITTAMSLICRLVAAVAVPSDRSSHREGPMQHPAALPNPELEPRAITLEEYHAHAPEKLELLEGYLFDTSDYPETRRQLLGLLLVNVGLLDTVRLAPEGLWREALRQAYGAGPRAEGP